MTAREQWKAYHRIKRIFDRIDRENRPIKIEVPDEPYKIQFDIKMRMPEGPIMPVTFAAS